MGFLHFKEAVRDIDGAIGDWRTVARTLGPDDATLATRITALCDSTEEHLRCSDKHRRLHSWNRDHVVTMKGVTETDADAIRLAYDKDRGFA